MAIEISSFSEGFPKGNLFTNGYFFLDTLFIILKQQFIIILFFLKGKWSNSILNNKGENDNENNLCAYLLTFHIHRITVWYLIARRWGLGHWVLGCRVELVLQTTCSVVMLKCCSLLPYDTIPTIFHLLASVDTQVSSYKHKHPASPEFYIKCFYIGYLVEEIAPVSQVSMSHNSVPRINWEYRSWKSSTFSVYWKWSNWKGEKNLKIKKIPKIEKP